MNIDFKKGLTLDIFRDYISFVGVFSFSPSSALQKYSKTEIDIKLLLFMVIGVVVSGLALRVASSVGIEVTPSKLKNLSQTLSSKELLSIIVISIVIGAFIFHGLVKAWMKFNKWSTGK